MEAAALDPTADLAARRARALSPWPETRPLRAWQAAALDQLLTRPEGSFLTSATPAAGKTTFGLRVAHTLLTAGVVSRVAVVAPTAHIARQWAVAAAAVGIDLEANRSNADGPEPRDRHGLAVTYQAVAAGPGAHRRPCGDRATLLIADEPHHMGELAAWGRSTEKAFADAKLKLLLSGTPFRSDNTAIPWVTYDDDGVSSADVAYGYTEALLDGVCRPITFLAYDGEMTWRSGGRQRTAGFELGLPRAESARRLRTALDPEGDWIGRVLVDADARLSEVRAAGHPEAGGLVVCADRDHARAIAPRLERICGETVGIVTADDPAASSRIDGFATGRARWLVSVLMVSEGVDIPRLRVGVYATAARTELFFRQVVGRFVRRTPMPPSQMSYLLLPADPTLKALAATIEEERRHALAERPELEERDAPDGGAAGEGFVALSSSGHLEDVIRSTTRPGDALTLFADAENPSLATPGSAAGPEAIVAEPSPVDLRERLRDERQRLVTQLARATRESHATIHGRINQATGAATVASATDDQLDAGNARLSRELEKARGRGPWRE
jgi:superfamily II DNA or RNA helicase